MSSSPRSPLDTALLTDALLLDLAVCGLVVTKVDEDNVLVTMRLKDDADLLSTCVWGLVFTIGSLAFETAPLHANLEADLVTGDRWTVGDMLAHLTLENGRLRFHADVVRGRCVRTKIAIDPDGAIFVETSNRGQVLTQWIATLRNNGMPHLSDGERCDDDPSAFS